MILRDKGKSFFDEKLIVGASIYEDYYGNNDIRKGINIFTRDKHYRFEYDDIKLAQEDICDIQQLYVERNKPNQMFVDSRVNISTQIQDEQGDLRNFADRINELI